MAKSATAKKPEVLKIRQAGVAELTEDPENTRRHNKRNLAAIKGSIETFGQVEPLVVQKGTGRVIGGNGRLSVLRELGVKTVGVVEVDVDDAKAKALSIALNRAGDLGTWDEAALTSTLAELQEHGFDLAVVGFDAADLAKRFSGLRDLVTDDLPEAPTDGIEPVGRVASNHVRQVQLFMPLTTFEKFQAQLADLQRGYETTNVTDTVLRAIEEVHAALKAYEANKA